MVSFLNTKTLFFLLVFTLLVMGFQLGFNLNAREEPETPLSMEQKINLALFNTTSRQLEQIRFDSNETYFIKMTSLISYSTILVTKETIIFGINKGYELKETDKGKYMLFLLWFILILIGLFTFRDILLMFIGLIVFTFIYLRQKWKQFMFSKTYLILKDKKKRKFIEDELKK